jgi:ABC-2 type transport system permease protein
MRQYLSKQNRALLSELVRTDFKLRYQGSVLGYAWSLLRPLFMFVILYFVFTTVFPLGKGIPHFPVYLFIGIAFWNFFVEMTSQSLGSVVGRGDLIRKISIPRWIIILSSSFSALISFLLNLVVLAIFMVINHVDLMASILWLPLIIIEVYVFALGLSLILSAMFVRFRDLNYIWEVIIQAGFYLTPILYPLTRVQSVTYQKWILLNPMAQAIQDARYAVVSHDSVVVTINRVFDNGYYQLIPYVIVVLSLVIGIFYFRKHSKRFAEEL